MVAFGKLTKETDDLMYRVLALMDKEANCVRYQAQVSTNGGKWWTDIDLPWEHERNAWSTIRSHAENKRKSIEAKATVETHDSTPKTYRDVLAEIDRLKGDD
jgi:hypothetical protein